MKGYVTKVLVGTQDFGLTINGTRYEVHAAEPPELDRIFAVALVAWRSESQVDVRLLSGKIRHIELLEKD